MGSNPLKLLANFYPKFGARMELENDDKSVKDAALSRPKLGFKSRSEH